MPHSFWRPTRARFRVHATLIPPCPARVGAADDARGGKQESVTWGYAKVRARAEWCGRGQRNIVDPRGGLAFLRASRPGLPPEGARGLIPSLFPETEKGGEGHMLTRSDLLGRTEGPSGGSVTLISSVGSRRASARAQSLARAAPAAQKLKRHSSWPHSPLLQIECPYGRVFRLQCVPLWTV